MITFILLAAGLILVVGAIAIAYGANQRKRAGQSGGAVAVAQTQHTTKPTTGRAPGAD